jgi:hypothetical protein
MKLTDRRRSVRARFVSVLTTAVIVAASGEAAPEPPSSSIFKFSDELPRTRRFLFPRQCHAKRGLTATYRSVQSPQPEHAPAANRTAGALMLNSLTAVSGTPLELSDPQIRRPFGTVTTVVDLH